MRTTSHPPSTANERTRLLAEAARLLDDRRSCLAGPQPPRDLAVEIANRLEGTLVSQASRARIMDLADRMGIRRFEASLLIAQIQDRARRGEPVPGPLTGLGGPPAIGRSTAAATRLHDAGLRLTGLLAGAGLVLVAIGWLLA